MRQIWRARSRATTAGALIVMAVMATLMIVRHFRVLVIWPHGAIDLKYYYAWVRPWFGGVNIYARPDRPEYPPASMALLWPLVGWPSLATAKSVAAWTNALALTGLAVWMARASPVKTFEGRLFAALLLLSMTPTGAALGNGQLILLVLPCILGGLAILLDRPPSLVRDVAAATLLTVSLVKPSISVPFFWMLWLARAPWRALIFVGIAYAGLTLFAASFQPADLWTLLTTAVTNGERTASMAIDGNVHFLLRVLHLNALMLPVTAGIWLALGWWIRRHRHLDRALLLAVVALVARLWTYHRVYDGVLVVFAELALMQIAASHGDDERADAAATAGILLGLTALLFLSPGPGANLPLVPDLILGALQGCITGVDLIFLLYYSATVEPKRAGAHAARA